MTSGHFYLTYTQSLHHLNLDDQIKELTFMGYTNSRAKMKLWDPHINTLKCCSSAKFDGNINNFGNGCLLVY